ncbi:MAG: hypothetical protein M3Y27_28750 [Acidobacteriota bacterium]|nr:hypothetical protein [Acidobacteriota bacterium]
MVSDELRAALVELDLSQADLGRLVSVTPRAVSLWLASARAIPGPVEAYLRLLQSLSPAQLGAELTRVGAGIPTLRAGIWRFKYQNAAGHGGTALLVFDAGRIYGTDLGKSQYDGNYSYNHASGMVDLMIRVGIKAGERSVAGPAQRFDWILEAKLSLPPKVESGVFEAETNVEMAVSGQFEHMRELPPR